MSISEKDAVLRERAAFEAGVIWERSGAAMSLIGPTVFQEIRRRYSLPKVKRPRVVKDPHEEFDQQWKCEDGRIWWRNYREPWKSLGDGERIINPNTIAYPTPERIRLWADLLANPTEEVEA